MSKFFQQDSSSETDSESDVEIEQQPQLTRRTAAARVYDDSDVEEEKARVVLPERQRRLEEINGLIKQLKNAKKIKDVVKVNEVFEDMVKSYDKCKKVIEKDGQIKQYLVAISELEEFINMLWADTAWRSAASRNNATSLSKLRQRIRKYIKEFESELSDLKSSGGMGEDNASSESGSEKEKDDSDDDVKASSSKKQKDSDSSESSDESDSDDDDSSDWSSSETSSSSDSDGYDANEPDIWKKFLKKDEAGDKKEKIKKDRVKKIKKVRRNEDDEDEDGEKVGIEKPKLFAKDEEINHDSVLKKLNQICSGRGRKGTDRKMQMEMVCELKEISKQNELGDALNIKILLNQIAIHFDYNPRLNKSMKSDTWNKCLVMLEEILDTLIKNDNIEVNDSVQDDEENFKDDKKPYKIKGCVLTITDRMTEEFVRLLQQCDAHGSEYVGRLKDEPKVCAHIDRLLGYLENKGDKQQICRVYLKKVENIYYKYDNKTADESLETVDRLCKYIYTNDTTDRLRTKAMLCHIYHNALHDRWFEARDLMLMSHLQESIDNSDVPLQILYNRTMVQVGLCAFRVGNIKEAHAALLDIQIGNRAKELLAQGVMVQRNVEKTKEQEVKERQRLIPFHMHINLELIECMYLISAMLIEIPYMCTRDYETKKISKQFYYQLKNSEKQPVVGPPENMREHVVAASKAMRKGDWKECINFLINEKMNAKVWDLMPQSENVKQMLTIKVKEESLRTYLFKFSSIYESISIQTLADMFDLPRAQVYSSISKMIINEELMASLDQPTQTVIMHRTEPTKLQTLALQLSDKITVLMDTTERMMTKGGDMGSFVNRNQQGQSQQNPNYKGDNRGQQQKNNPNYKGNKNKNKDYHNKQSNYHNQHQHQQKNY